MNRTLTIKPWLRVDAAEPDTQSGYDGLISVVGYEERACYVSKAFHNRSRRLFACAFDDRKVLSFGDNVRWFENNGFEVKESEDSEFGEWCKDVLTELCSTSEGRIRISVDISSMSRYRIAILAACLFELRGGQSLDVDFLYAPAEFSKPSYEEGPIVTSKPVIDVFAGWSTEPEKPAAAILGLGTERDKAIGTMEYLEPGEVWVFKPTGEDPRYDAEMERANTDFLNMLPGSRTMTYRVDRAFDCFARLESVAYGGLRSGRPVLVPFGPKIFTLSCLLVACVHYPSMTVWRVSSEQHAAPVNRIANGKIVGLNVEFAPTKVTLPKDG